MSSKEVSKKLLDYVNRNYETADHRVWKDALRAAPLVEMCSVTISAAKAKEKPCQIYGQINVITENGIVDSLYNQKEEDPEIVQSGSAISLIGPYAALQIGNSLSVNLWDKARKGGVVAKGSFPLKKESTDGYEEVICHHVLGDGGCFASVFYFLLPYAVVADLNITLSKPENEDDEGGFADVHGTILACSVSPYLRIPSHFREKHISSELFSKQPCKCQKVKYGTPIELSKSLVAVPACSSFIVKLDLHDSSSQIVKDQAKFETNSRGTYSHTFHSKEKGHFIEVVVDFLSERMPPPKSGCYPLPSPDWPISGHPLSVEKRKGFPLMEIFSVFIGRLEDKALRLHGDIVVRDIYCKRSIFARSNNSPEILSLHNTILTLTGPVNYAFHGDLLSMTLCLSDEENQVQIEGTIGWAFINLPRQELWLNTRLSSVFPGENGFAAMHYTIFSAAVQASLTAQFFCKGSDLSGIDVEGSIVARYSDHEYSTPFERKYYQSLLFNSSKENPVKLMHRYRISLSKPVVVVPSKASLVVEVNLSLVDGESLLKSTKVVNIGDSMIILKGKDSFIKFDIVWGGLNM